MADDTVKADESEAEGTRLVDHDWSDLNAFIAGEHQYVPITLLMQLLWLTRSDLHRIFPLDDDRDRLNFVDWYLTDGSKQMGLGDWLVPVYDYGSLAASVSPLPAAPPWLREGLALALWRREFRAQGRQPELSSPSAFFQWFITSGRSRYGLNEMSILRELFQNKRTSAALKFVTNAAVSEVRKRSGRLIRSFIRRVMVPGLGRAGTFGLLEPPAGVAPPRPVAPIVEGPRPVVRLRVRARRSGERASPGVNLVGYPKGELGLGEDLRTAAHCLTRHDVKISIADIGRRIAARQQDGSVAHLIDESNRFRTNIFCISGLDMFLPLKELGPTFFDGRYNIGHWPWELPSWPEAAEVAFTLVDEIWAISRFTAVSLRARASVPVIHMPPAVILPNRPSYTRRHFRLPNSAFLFVLTFDCNSFMARKNPWAAVSAFRDAFPRGNEDVGLVIKVMNARKGHPEWERLLQQAHEDRRIILFSRTMNRREVVGLVDVCDAYVSLHRAEGFGRGPAEAMALGKPVIVTDFSGTQDFCNESNACLVPYELISVGADEYPFAEGQQWAEPNIEAGARHMVQLAQSPALVEQMGGAARDYMERHHSVTAVGKAYVRRLAKLDLI